MGTCETLWTESNEYEIFLKTQKIILHEFLWFLGIKFFSWI